MAKIEASVVIDRPVEDVWKFMSDMSNDPKWNPETLEVKQVSTGPLAVGTILEDRHPKQTFRIRLYEYEPNRKFGYESISGPSKGSRVSYSMETTEGKTRLNLTLEPSFSGFYKLVGPFAHRGIKRQVPPLVGNIKRALESEARS
jgi:uncharacterized membrane protein